MPSPRVVFAQNSVTQWSVGDTLTPIEGPYGISAILDFTKYAEFLFNGEQMFGAANPESAFSGVQSVYVDAQGTDDTVYVSVSQSQQTIAVKGRTQGYYPLIAPNVFNIAVTCADALVTNVQIILLNFMVPPAQWATK